VFVKVGKWFHRGQVFVSSDQHGGKRRRKHSRHWRRLLTALMGVDRLKRQPEQPIQPAPVNIMRPV